MKQIIIGIILRDHTKSINPKTFDHATQLIQNTSLFSNVDLTKTSWCSSDLPDNNVRKIRDRCTDNQEFIENGAWSIISLDKVNHKLILVRDFLGIHPLYYTLTDSSFVFSNNLQSLLKYCDKPLRLDYKSLGDMLFYNRMDYTKKTLLQGIYEVNQGESVSFDYKSWSIKSRDYRSFHKREEPESFESLVRTNHQEIRGYIDQNYDDSEGVKNALLLSGGLDSSCLAYALNSSGRKKSTSFYTISYPEHSFDETLYAKEVVKDFPESEWYRITPSTHEFLDDIEELHRVIEWPTLSSGTYNQFKLLQNCQDQGENVIWDGLGADAIYGGHDYYRHQLMKEYIGKFRINAARELLGWKGNHLNELKVLIKGMIKRKILNSKSMFSTFITLSGEQKLYNRDFLQSYLQNQDDHKVPNSLKDIMSRDYYDGGVRHLSRFTNRISRQFNLEMKYPYAENIKWAQRILSLPESFVFKNGVSKAILRASFKDQLAPKVLNRRDKLGLVSPNNEWIDFHKDKWVQYFEGLEDIYDVSYIKDNYKALWSLSKKPENYRHFRHISFAIWYKVMGL